MILSIKRYYALLILTLSSLGLSVVFLFIHFQGKPELVYVDNIRLFNEFQMSHDLMSNNMVIDTYKKGLDSLYGLYSAERERENSGRAAHIEGEIRNWDQELKALQEEHSKHVGQQVWLKLNEYIQDYADRKGFTIVFGTQGTGNIMFAGEGMDITAAVLDYANQKYQESK